MNANWQDVARITLEEAESDTMSFPEGVRILMEAGFDGYAIDFRRSTRAYYMSNDAAIELKTAQAGPVAERFDAVRIREAIQEAQAMVPGYSYKGFCAKVTAAGCAGYLVSLIGRRVVYYGRTGETHTEYFPGSGPAGS